MPVAVAATPSEAAVHDASSRLERPRPPPPPHRSNRTCEERSGSWCVRHTIFAALDAPSLSSGLVRPREAGSNVSAGFERSQTCPPLFRTWMYALLQRRSGRVSALGCPPRKAHPQPCWATDQGARSLTYKPNELGLRPVLACQGRSPSSTTALA